MTPVYITVIACVLFLFLVAKYLAWSMNGMGEQSDENKKMIEREKEILAIRMKDFSENKNQ